VYVKKSKVKSKKTKNSPSGDGGEAVTKMEILPPAEKPVFKSDAV
jgi:hypothetical protein